MLVKFFKHGNIKNATGGRSGGGGAVRDYLLKDKKDKSQPRTGASVFRGDPELTTEIINGIKNSSIYTSGVLSFSADEQPSDQQLNEIVDSFENTLFPNLDDDQYSSYWVKHEDKGRTELHFVFANIELTTQKSLPVYYHKKDLDLIDNWKDIANYEYGLIDPNSPDRKRDLVLSQINFDDQTDDQLKDKIHDEIFNEVTQNKNIKSRADIVNLFKSKGYEVTRQGKKENSISIKHPHQKDNPDKKLRNLKFKGELYSPTFNRDQLNKDVKFYNSKRDQRIQNKRQSFEIELENRRKRLETKFSKIDRTPLDNKLTYDLKNIKSNTADMAEWQRQMLKQIIAESLESVSSGQSGELQQILFDSIDSQIKDEPLPEFDQIIQNYQSRIAQHQAELAQQERLARLSNIRVTGDELRQYVVDFNNSSYQSVIERESQYIATMQAIEQGNEPLTDDILATYKQARDFVSYTAQWRNEGRLDEKQQSEIRKAERLAEQQQRQAEQAQLEQQRLEQQQFEQALTEQKSILNTDYGILPEEFYSQFESMTNEQLYDDKEYYEAKLQMLFNKAQHELLSKEEINEYQAKQLIINSIDNIIAEREQLEQDTQTAEPTTAPTMGERSNEEVAQPTYLDQPPEPEITLNAKQQIVFDIASKYFLDDDPDEMKNYVSSLSDSELRNIENPHQSSHDEYVRLANSYAQSLHDKATATAQAELAQLKKLIPKRPDDTKLHGKQWDKAFEKWNNDRVLPEANVRNKEIELNNLKNQTVRATPIHFDKIAKDRPDLLTIETDYKQFEQFVSEVNRALNHLDKQQQTQEQKQVKKLDLDK